MSLFGPPNVEKMKARRDINGLLKALTYPQDENVRYRAARALGDLGIKEAAGPLAERLISEENPLIKEGLVRILETLGWTPSRDRAGAWFWYKKWDLAKCVACGSAAIEPLLPLTLEGNFEVRKAYVSLGQPAYEVLCSACDALFNQYANLAMAASGMDFRATADRSNAALVGKLVDRLKNCVSTLGDFGTPTAEAYLIKLYHRVRASIPSDSSGGFNDLFQAVSLRQRIVSAMQRTCGEAGWPFLAETMTNDPARAVRIESANAVRELAKRFPGKVQSPPIQDALRRIIGELEADQARNAQEYRALLVG